MIDNSMYGGFVVAKSVLSGTPIRYSYREESRIRQLNGWHVLSATDTDEYVNDPNNFEIVSAEVLFKVCPQFSMIFNAPYGTDLFWVYTQGIHTGFYDLRRQRDTTIPEILGEECEQTEEA